MKKTMFFLYCFLLAMPAQAWVFLHSVQEKAPSLLLPKIIKQQGSVRVCMDVLNQENRPYANFRQEDYARGVYQEVRPFIEPGYQMWIDTLRKTIQNSGRSVEFADVLSLLPTQKLSFQFINPDAAACTDDQAQDLYIRLVPLIKTNAAAFVRQHNHFFAMTLQTNETRLPEMFQAHLLHEIGHTLGLGDMYPGPYKDASGSRIYTTASIQPLPQTPSCMNRNCSGQIEKNPYSETRVIWGEEGSRTVSKSGVREVFKPNSAEKLTCDDMDGLVNLLDYYFPERMSKRRTEGWLSFCRDKNVAYAYSLPFTVTPQEKEQFVQFVQNGRLGLSPLIGKTDFAAHYTQNIVNGIAPTEDTLRRKQLQQQARQEVTQSVEQHNNVQLPAAVPTVPDECPVCHKPLRGTESIRMCDRDKNRRIRGGCIYIHKGCKGDLGKPSVLRSFLQEVEPKYIGYTEKTFIAY